VARSVGVTRRVLVASPQYLKRHPAPRLPVDISRHDVIQFTGLSPTPEWRFFKAGAETRVGLTPRYVTNSADAAIARAELGGGLALVLAYQVLEAVRARKLQILLDDFEPEALPIHLVYPTTRLLSAKVRAFVELVAKTCDWRFVAV
jgi:DNA-binding transcriptional LysR family regulator